jgi:hypothetical protein
MATQEIWDEIDVSSAVAELKARLLEEASPGLGVFNHFAYEYGYDRTDDFDPRIDQDIMSQFESFLDEKAREEVHEQIARLSYDVNPVDGKLAIYRAIVVPLSWVPEDLSSRPLGVCWSWDEQFAISYVGGGDESSKDIRLTGKVAVADIDWELTVALNAANSYWGEDEREIRIRTDAKVDISLVESRAFGSEDVYEPVCSLHDKVFIAEHEEMLGCCL